LDVDGQRVVHRGVSVTRAGAAVSVSGADRSRQAQTGRARMKRKNGGREGEEEKESGDKSRALQGRVRTKAGGRGLHSKTAYFTIFAQRSEIRSEFRRRSVNMAFAGPRACEFAGRVASPRYDPHPSDPMIGVVA
jgi:hypothetical protein